MAGVKLPFEKETTQLYRGVLHSLEDEAATYLIDDYLSGIELLHRNPIKCDSNAVYYTMKGPDHPPSVTYLLNTKGYHSDAPRSGEESASVRNKNYQNLVAEKLVSAALAMRIVSVKAGRDPPIDVSFILLGSDREQQPYEYFNVRSLREAIMENSSSAEHRTHLVVVESTGLRVCNVQKGCLIFKLIIKGSLHSPAFTWLGENPWEALARFEKGVDDFIKPRHDLYPLDFGKAPPATLSNFLIGYPTIATTQIRSDQSYTKGESNPIESHHYVSVPPESSHEELRRKLLAIAKDVEKSSGCRLSIEEEFEEEAFHEDPHSLVVSAGSKAFLKLSGFDPVFEWLPFPVSAGKLKASGFAEDVVAFGPGDWTFGNTPNEKGIVNEILQASSILAMIPYEAAALEEEQSKDRCR